MKAPTEEQMEKLRQARKLLLELSQDGLLYFSKLRTDYADPLAPAVLKLDSVYLTEDKLAIWLRPIKRHEHD